MLSYQHIYHAGCKSDVHKHAALSLILSQMVKKDKPLYYLETHAGRGLYDLNSSESNKTGEALGGIIALEKKFPAEHPYKKALRQIHQTHGKNFYPGSPLIAHNILRQTDRLFLNELHPQEFAALKTNLGNYRNTFLHHADGFAKTLSLSPPIVRRGLVLIDPSYEVKTEYAATANFIRDLHKKWPEAVIMLWYPILKSGLHKEMCAELKSQNLPKFWQQEITFARSYRENNTLGSGLIICNLPHNCEHKLNQKLL